MTHSCAVSDLLIFSTQLCVNSTYLEADWVGWPDKSRSTTSLLIFYIGVYEFLRHLVRNKLFHAKY